ncbi:MAG: universal stress protein, partial [Alphaproteobacteria bacterium]|nr:universal stress protein [Alphaproteobacteria bacterium]
MSVTTSPESPAAGPADGKASTAPVSLRRILVALDASDHADRATEEAGRLARSAGGSITGIHAYAARLHDARFRQMEGGLPERYLKEDEMEYQREVHDDLISRGLNIITDSYHDVAEGIAKRIDLPYHRLSPEGKNYRKIVEAAETGEHDVIALGALGLGAVPGSLIGTVCERVVRRSPIDCLVIKDPAKVIGDGPLVVGLDGSDRSYGALKTAFDIARRVDAPVHAVAVYDPYYHYVAFNRIAAVLSDEAGEVFRFKEQEKLHEELIDDGLAKIYESHLEVAKKIAEADGMELHARLLDGKPFRAIADYVAKVGASLLLLGKTGIHTDERLDIGGNTENLLRNAACHLWLGQVTFTPEIEAVAEETTAWSDEALALLNRAPEFARDMARKAVLRHAAEQGHTFITKDMVEEVAAKMMPGRGAAGAGGGELVPLTWSAAGEALLAGLNDPAMAGNIRLRAEKAARRAKSAEVGPEHVRPFLDLAATVGGTAEAAEEEAPLAWEAAALARLARVPEPMRQATKARIEGVARRRGLHQV